jgi:hypothetical protein
MDIGPKRDLTGKFHAILHLYIYLFFFELSADLASIIRNQTNIIFGLYHSMYE